MQDNLPVLLEQAGSALAQHPVQSWHLWIVWLLALDDFSGSRADVAYEKFLRELKDDIEARLATGHW